MEVFNTLNLGFVGSSLTLGAIVRIGKGAFYKLINNETRTSILQRGSAET